MSKRGHNHWIAFRKTMLADLPALLDCKLDELPAVLTVMGRPKALKVGIMLDMLAKYPHADEPKLANWVRRWTGHWEYLKRIAHGCNRHDLEGKDVAPITYYEREQARIRLEAKDTAA